MNVNDENSDSTTSTAAPAKDINADQYGENGSRQRRSKGNRRSSILKMTKSPKGALDDIDPNTEHTESKKSRRSSSRRVSFAQTCQIKEIPNVAKKKSWPWEDNMEFNNNENPVLHLDLSNTADQCEYRKPAATLAGLSSLLSSPIQDNPEKAGFYELGDMPNELDNTKSGGALDFTTCAGFEANMSVSHMEKSMNQMDMTDNDFGAIIEAEEKNRRRQPFQEIKEPCNIQDEGDFRDDRTSSLDFTHCYAPTSPPVVPGEDSTLNEMELTRNQTLNIINENDVSYKVSPSKRELEEQLYDIGNEVANNPMYRSYRKYHDEAHETINKTSSLDFTTCVGAYTPATSDSMMEDATVNHMEMTQHGFGKIMREEIQTTQRQPFQEIQPASGVAEKTSLDLTKCYNVDEVQLDENTSDQMELTAPLNTVVNKKDGEQELNKTPGKAPISRQRQALQEIPVVQAPATQIRNEIATRCNVKQNIQEDVKREMVQSKECGKRDGSAFLRMLSAGTGPHVDRQLTEPLTRNDQLKNHQREPGSHHDKTQWYQNDQMNFTQSLVNLGTEIPRSSDQTQEARNVQMDFTMCGENRKSFNMTKQHNHTQMANEMDFTLCKGSNGVKPAVMSDQTRDHRNVQMDLTICGRNQLSRKDDQTQLSNEMNFTIWQESHEVKPPSTRNELPEDTRNDHMDFTICKGSHEPTRPLDQTQYSGNNDMEFTIHKVSDGMESPASASHTRYGENDPMDFTMHKVSDRMESPAAVNQTHYGTNEQMDFTLYKGKPTTIMSQQRYPQAMPSLSKNQDGEVDFDMEYHHTGRFISNRNHSMVHNETSNMMNMTCQVPQHKSYAGDMTSQDDGDIMEMTRCVPDAEAHEPKGVVPCNIPNQIEKGTSHDGKANTQGAGDATWTATDGPRTEGGTMAEHGVLNKEHHLEDWSIDISRFGRSSCNAGTSDEAQKSVPFGRDSCQNSFPRNTEDVLITMKSESKATAEVTRCAPTQDNPSQDIQTVTPNLEHNSLKQGNIERKAMLDDDLSLKRRALNRGDLTTFVSENTPGSTSSDASVPLLSRTLPIKSSDSATLVPRVHTDLGVNTSSAPGTHQVIPARNTIFGAKGPGIGTSKLGVLNRKPALKNTARFENISLNKIKHAATPLSIPDDNHDPSDGAASAVVAKPGIEQQRTTSENEVVLGSVGATPPPVVHEEPVEKESSDKKEGGSAHPTPAATKSPMVNLVSNTGTQEMFITDENSGVIMMSEEILNIQEGLVETSVKTSESVPNETQAEKNVVHGTFDKPRSETTSTTKKHLSMFSTDDQPIGGEENGEKRDGSSGNDSVQKPLTLQEFLSMAELNFCRTRTERSVIPQSKPDVQPLDLKDKIYKNCISAAKYSILDNFTKEVIVARIDENERLFAAKEKELNECNPPIFQELQKAVETEKQDEIIEKLVKLKRVCRYQATTEWYDLQTELNKKIVVKLKEQEEILQDDLSMLQKSDKEVDDCLSELDDLLGETDKKIQDFKALLELKEKEFSDYKGSFEKEKIRLEKAESDLQQNEEEREKLVSESESLSSEITEEKKEQEKLQNEIKELEEEDTLLKSAAECEEQMRLLKSIVEPVLEEYNSSLLKFTFFQRTFDLDIVLEDTEVESDYTSLSQKVQSITFKSALSENSIPLAQLMHQLVQERFSECNFLEMFPTRGHLPALLQVLSQAISRVKSVYKSVRYFSINHIVTIKNRLVTIEFSSLPKFIKFKLIFDLSNMLSDGLLPYKVEKKIGHTSADAIAHELSKVPSTVISFRKVVATADKFI